MYHKRRDTAKETTPGTLKSQHRQGCTFSSASNHPEILQTNKIRYLVSVLLYPLFGGCETPSLRMLNVGTICLICLLTYHILRNNRSRSSTKQALMKNDEDSQTYLLDAHSALNISLFPPLFFFSGLYYTDVMSTLVVLLSYNGFLKRREGNLRAWDQFFTVFIGAIALTLRQTNIFWVAVFPAGLTAIDTLKKNGTQPALEVKSTLAEVLEKSWREGLVYDCSVPEAGIMGIAIHATYILKSKLMKHRLYFDPNICSSSFLEGAFDSFEGNCALSYAFRAFR